MLGGGIQTARRANKSGSGSALSGRSRSSPRKKSPGKSRRPTSGSITVIAASATPWEITPFRSTFPQAVATGGGFGFGAGERAHRGRRMLSASARPGLRPSASGVAVRNCLKVLACYAPQQFRVAYGIQPLLDRGIDGRGETVVLLEQEVPTQAAPPKVTDIRQDLARFDGLFGLPAARLQVVNSLARSPSPWLADEEEVEDTEIVHAVAPEADIREILVSDSDVESPAATATDGSAALRLGVTQGAVISVSSG